MATEGASTTTTLTRIAPMRTLQERRAARWRLGGIKNDTAYEDPNPDMPDPQDCLAVGYHGALGRDTTGGGGGSSEP